MKRTFLTLLLTVSIVGWHGLSGRGVASAADQTADVKAFHRAGQTFITFKEIGQPPAGEAFTWGQAKKILADSKIAYRVYASDKPISDVSAAELLGEVKPLSGWNLNGRNTEYLIGQAMIQPDEMGELTKNYNGYIRSWGMNHQRMDRYPLSTLVIDEKAGPLPRGTGLYVANPTKAGKRHYAVAAVVDGKVNAAGVPSAGPVEETVGAGEPVKQGKGLWGPYFDYAGTRVVYVQWCAPPLAPVEGMYFNWSVLVPPEKMPGATFPDKRPAELFFHAGNASYAQPNKKLMAHSFQFATHDWPDSGWYGYNDAIIKGEPAEKGTVSNHTQKRIAAFMDWAKTAFPIAGDQIIPTGSDGAALLALNYPDRFAYVWITGFERYSVLDKEAAKDYEAAWGPKSADIKDDQGRGDWSWAFLDKVIAAKPGVDLPPFIVLGASWGRVPGYARGNGLFYDAMQKARQPLYAYWGWSGSRNRGDVNPYTGIWKGHLLTTASPVPAFSNSSANSDKEATGNVNGTFNWSDVTDTADSFAMTIASGEGSFDVTGRRVANFKAKPGEKIAWTAEYTARDARTKMPEPSSGVVEADELGLVTVKGLAVPKGGSGVKLTLTKAK